MSTAMSESRLYVVGQHGHISLNFFSVFFFSHFMLQPYAKMFQFIIIIFFSFSALHTPK